MTKRLVVIGLVAAVVSTGVGLGVEILDQDKKLRGLHQPFAIWPVDTLGEAEQECARGQEWRESAEDTVVRFAERIGIEQDPEVSVGFEGRNEGGATITGPGIPLEHSVGVRRAFGCWYVTNVRNREDFASFNAMGYAGLPPNRELFLYFRPIREEPQYPLLGSFGSGGASLELTEDDLEYDDDGTLLTLPANARAPGHFLIAWQDQPLDTPGYPEGFTIDAAPSPEGSVDIPDIRSIKRAFATDASAGDCNRWWYGDKIGAPVEGRRGRAVLNNMNIVRQELDIEQRLQLEQLRGGDFSVRLGDVELLADYWRAGGCKTLGRIAPVGEGSEGIRSIRVNTEGFFFELDWGRATHAYLLYGFGNNSGSTTVGREAQNPLSLRIGEYYANYPPGEYVVAFARGDEILSVYASALPSLGAMGAEVEDEGGARL